MTSSESVEVVSNQEKELNFQLRIAQPAELVISPSSMNFGELIQSIQLSIDNAGDKELIWEISTSESWLSVFPSSGTTNYELDEVTVTVDRSNLSVDSYNANILISSNGGDYILPISMIVPEVGLMLSSNDLNFETSISEMSVTISNAGQGELNWEAITSDSWISISPNSGMITTNTQNVNITINRQALDSGYHEGYIYLTSNGGNITINIIAIVSTFPAPTLYDPYNESENSMTLAWDIIEDEAFKEYRLYRSTTSNTDMNSELITTITNPNINTFNDTNLSGGTTYYYRLYSVNLNNEIFASNVVSAATLIGIGSWGIAHQFPNGVNLNSIFAFSDDNVWVAGDYDGISIIYHRVGSTWIEIMPPDIGIIEDLDFSSENDGWAVSNDGVLHYNGSIWTIVEELSGAHSVDANSPNDIWFANSSNDGCFRYYNGEIIPLGINGYEIEVENNFGVIIGYQFNNNINAYIYNGITWSQPEDIIYASGSTLGNFAKAKIINEKIYVSTKFGGSSNNALILYENGMWTTITGGGWNESFLSFGVQNENLIWIYYVRQASRLMEYYNGEEIISFCGSYWFGSCELDHMLDMHFISNTVGWSCGNSKVYRYE